MKNVSLIIIGWLITSIHVFAQDCQCEPLELPSRTLNISVVTSAQLNDALHMCRGQGGNCEIIIQPGEYVLTQNLLYIDESMSNLTISGSTDNASDVIIRGQGHNGNVTHIFNVAADHFILANMTIGWVKNHAVQIHGENDADSCLIYNVHFVDIGEQMLKVSSGGGPHRSDFGIVQCCLFEFTNDQAFQYYTGGVDAHYTRNWSVLDNEFYNIVSPESRLSEHAIHFWSEAEGTIVEGNKIVNCDRGIGLGLGDRGHGHAQIRHNMIHTSRDVGIGLESVVGALVEFNTIVTDNYANSIEYRFNRSDSNSIKYNLVSGRVHLRDGGKAELAQNVVISDPSLFEDYSGHDYHLAGPDTSVVGRAPDHNKLRDFDCNIHEIRNDIGADEWQDISTSILSEQELGLEIFPNPSSGPIYICCKEAFSYILTDYTGNVVEVGHSNKESKSVTLKSVSGAYILKVFTQNASVCKRLIFSSR